jgi:phospholipid/cholesterol/gamma-HCH transport system substrate-binding protein
LLATKGSEGLTEMLKGGENVVKLLELNLINLKKITDSFAENKKSEQFFSKLTAATINLNEALEDINKGKGLKELNSTLKNLRVMTDRINNGEGTIGALLNDTSLYEDMKNLIGGASRNSVLKFFVKQAVKTSSAESEKKDAAEKKSNAKKDPASIGSQN